jgi:GntR family transcriptional regulator
MNDSLAAGGVYANPLYKEVTIRITQSLAEGKWKPGEAIPSESQLAGHFKVSIGTIRKAIDELVANRILVRQPGRGTFVSTHTENRYLYHFFRIVREDEVHAFPQTELVSFKRGKADAETASQLKITTGTPVFRFDNVLSLHGEPVIYDEIAVPEATFPALTRDMLASRDTTIYGMYQARYGINVIKTTEKLRAVLADHAGIAEALHLQAGDPLLELRRVAYTYHDQPVEYRRSYVNTGHYYYLSELGK